MTSGLCLRGCRVVRRYMPTNIGNHSSVVNDECNNYVSMYFEPFQPFGPVNTGVPPSGGTYVPQTQGRVKGLFSLPSELDNAVCAIQSLSSAITPVSLARRDHTDTVLLSRHGQIGGGIAHRSPRPPLAAPVCLDTDAARRPELPARSHDSEPTAAGERARRCRHRLKRHVIRVRRRKHLGVAVPHEEVHGEPATGSRHRERRALLTDGKAIVE